MQAIQEVFTTEKWVKDARNNSRLADNLRAETNKALGAAKQKNKELAVKLAIANRNRKSTEANLKTIEEQRKKLHYAEIELAMTKQEVVALQAELGKAKEAAQKAKAAMEASEQKFYELGV